MDKRIKAYKSKRQDIIDPRALRAHRRSVDWKLSREDRYNKCRSLTVEPKPQTPPLDPKRAQLQKWQEQRALKKKLEDNRKPIFKVSNFKSQDFCLYNAKPNVATRSSFSTTTSVAATPPRTRSMRVTVAKPTTPKHSRTTRGRPGVQNTAPSARPTISSKAHAVKPAVTGEPVTSGRVTRSRGPAPAPVITKPVNKCTRVASTSKPSIATTSATTTRVTRGRLATAGPGPAIAKPIRGRGKKAVATVPAPSAITLREPTNHIVFGASDNAEFVFRPLSPESVKRFLSGATGCSTPKQSSAVFPTPSVSAIPDVGRSTTLDDLVRGPALNLFDEVRHSPVPRKKTRRSAAAEISAVKPDSSSDERQDNNPPDLPVPGVVRRSRRSTRRSVLAQSMFEAASQLPVLSEESPVAAAVVPERDPVSAKPPSVQAKSTPEPSDVEEAPFRTPRSVTRVAQSRTASAIIAQSHHTHRTPKALQQSFILRHLSPEEGVQVLKMSPMIEMERRKPKLTSPFSPVEKPNFDDISDQVPPVPESTAPITTNTHSKDANDVITKLPGSECTADTASTVTADKSCDGVSAMSGDCVVPVVDPVQDVPYFRALLTRHTNELNELCDKWECIVSSVQLTEEDKGEVRVSIGKAQLIIAQRFKQFTGLVDDCEFMTSERVTTCEDLGGFWDMIYFQVGDVHSMFEKLEKLHANNWVREKPQVVKKRIVAKKPGSKVVANAKPKSSFAAFLKKKKELAKQKEDVCSKDGESEVVVVVPEGASDVMPRKASETAAAMRPMVLLELPETSSQASVKMSIYHRRSHTPKCKGRRSLNPELACTPLMQSIIKRTMRHSINSSSLPKVLPAYDRRTGSHSGGSVSAEHSLVPEKCDTPVSSRRTRGSHKHTCAGTDSPSGGHSAAVAALSALTLSAPEEQLDTERPAKFPPGLENAPSLFTPDSCVRPATRLSLSVPVEHPSPMETDSYSPTDKPFDKSLSRYLVPSRRSNNTPQAYAEMQLDSPLLEDVDMAAPMKRDLSSEFNKHSSAKCRLTLRCSPQPRMSPSMQKLSSVTRRSKRQSTSRRSALTMSPFMSSPNLRSRREKENASMSNLISFSPDG